jgi:luciferase family oxidoreductase group 1
LAPGAGSIRQGAWLAGGDSTVITTVPVSVLDLAPVAAGTTAAEAFRRSLELAQHAEHLGYRRFWLAEHHNMPGIASSATAIVIAHVAAGTSRIRVGAGGIMLPNHSPLVVAEQFGTLESLFPGRIDLGLGRAPGTDRETMMALRRQAIQAEEDFPQDVQQLRALLGRASPGQRVHAIPGEGLRVPIWLLGSSGFSARLAAALGLPFAFASHFAPDHLLPALDVYRREFRSSDALERPYVMAALNVVAADTDADARRSFTSVQQQFINLRRGTPTQLPPPVDTMDRYWSESERATVEHTLRYAVVGARETVRSGIASFLQQTAADELLVTAHIFDQAARLRSFEIVSDVMPELKLGPTY